MRPAPKVRTLFGGLFALVLVLPILMIGVARVYENQLVRNTEEILIAEAVVVGEAYRRAVDPAAAIEKLPVGADATRFLPFPPALDIRRSPMVGRATRDDSTVTSTAPRPGAELSAMLERSIIRNLAGVRVLDRRGIVVASPVYEVGYSLAHLPEVEAALEGRYAPVLRSRFSDEPSPPLSSLSRAANVRVSIAVPVYRDPRALPGKGGEVIGVIYNQRTPLDVSKALWLVRDDLVLPALISLVLTLLIASFLTATIARPLMRLRSAAEAVAKGEQKGSPIGAGRFAPQEIQALSESLAKMRDQLESRADYIREFAANTAHELKTPLTSLRGASELLLEESADMSDEQRRRFLSNIHSDAVRMDQLVGRILHLARIESTKPVREKLDLRAFLEGTVERYKRSGAELVLRYEASTPAVEMSADQLDSLVTNLIDNALRHGAGKVIELAVRDLAEGRTLEVRDHGPVLPEAHFERVFERFYTTERSRGGTGLGLAIVKAIAEAHGGSVRALRHANGGASFFVVLG